MAYFKMSRRRAAVTGLPGKLFNKQGDKKWIAFLN